MFQGPKLGEILVAAGVIDEIQLITALAEQQRYGGRLGATLLRSGALEERELVAALAAQIKLPVAHLEGKKIRAEVLALVPVELAAEHLCIPLFIKEERGGKTLYLGMEDPCDLAIQDSLAFRTGLRVRPVMVPPSELIAALERGYGVKLPADAQAWVRPSPIELSEPPDYVSKGPEDDALELADEVPSEEAPASGDAPPTATPRGPASTREILRALTQLLIETEVVDREQLHARVRSLQDAQHGDLA